MEINHFSVSVVCFTFFQEVHLGILPVSNHMNNKEKLRFISSDDLFEIYLLCFLECHQNELQIQQLCALQIQRKNV
jgi:hypothetical protein